MSTDSPSLKAKQVEIGQRLAAIERHLAKQCVCVCVVDVAPH